MLYLNEIQDHQLACCVVLGSENSLPDFLVPHVPKNQGNKYLPSTSESEFMSRRPLLPVTRDLDLLLQRQHQPSKGHLEDTPKNVANHDFPSSQNINIIISGAMAIKSYISFSLSRFGAVSENI